MQPALPHLLHLLLSDDEANYSLGVQLMQSQGLQSAVLAAVFPPEAFIAIAGGSFTMGEGDSAHPVRLSDFSMQRTPVTQRQYRLVMGHNPSYFRGGEDCPVEQVSWYDAVKFCNRLSEWAGLEPVYTIVAGELVCNLIANSYRLPTEAEWEFAARGGQQSQGYVYAGSNDLEEVAWCNDNAEDRTQPVKGKKPNELGLYDMTGNVLEWCWDWYDANYYKNTPNDNPIGAKKGLFRVLRGGSWEGRQPGNFHVCYRNYFYPGTRFNMNGFRLVRGWETR